MLRSSSLLLPLLLLIGCTRASSEERVPEPPAARPTATGETAYFAGGCFWCTEKDFEHVEGVLSVESGYAGGTEPDPTYEQVSAGRTSHAEAVRVTYDPKKTSYEKLARYFFRTIDPVDDGGQFCDRGSQYRSVLFFSGPQEEAVAQRIKADVQQALGEPVVTELVSLERFYEAEDYHQDFYKKNPSRYQQYRKGCRRDQRTAEVQAKLDAAKN